MYRKYNPELGRGEPGTGEQGNRGTRDGGEQGRPACCAAVLSANGGTPIVKVTLSLGSRAFQRQLASTLAARGMLSGALSFGMDLEVLNPDGTGGLQSVRPYPQYRLTNRILWAAWRRLPGSRYSRHFPVVLSTMYADRLLSGHVSACDVFHGWSGLSVACLRAAKRGHAVTII